MPIQVEPVSLRQVHEKPILRQLADRSSALLQIADHAFGARIGDVQTINDTPNRVSSCSMPLKNILALLKGGDRRSIGRSDEVAAIVSKNQALFPELIEGWWSENRLVRMRAADATEKVVRELPGLLLPYKNKFLGLMADAEEPELRWHLAIMVPRLPLNSKERQLATSLLSRYLEDRSSIVKTFALQGLVDLTLDHPSIRPEVIEILRRASRSGTPAMRARSRKLLRHLERV